MYLLHLSNDDLVDLLSKLPPLEEFDSDSPDKIRPFPKEAQELAKKEGIDIFDAMERLDSLRYAIWKEQRRRTWWPQGHYRPVMPNDIPEKVPLTCPLTGKPMTVHVEAVAPVIPPPRPPATVTSMADYLESSGIAYARQLRAERLKKQGS